MATTLKTREQVISRPRATTTNSGMLTGVSTLWLKHMRKFVTSRMEVFGTLGMPLLWMFLFGVCMETVLREITTDPNLHYKAFITPGVMMLTCLASAIMSGATLLVERINGVIKEYLVAPVPRLSILLGTMSSGLTKAVLQALIVLGLGLLLDPAMILNAGALLLGMVVLVIYSLGFVAVAAAVATRARGLESYHSLIMLLNLPVLFLSNALYPLAAMPVQLQGIAYLNPTTYAVDAIRHLFYGNQLEIGLWIDLPILLIFMTGAIWFAYKSFQKVMLNALD